MPHQGRRGSPGEEMFSSNSEQGMADSPTIEPLRVRHEQRAPSASGQRAANSYRTFAPPPGAMSSPAPLPYPTDPHEQPTHSRLPYPDDGPSTSPPPTNRFAPSGLSSVPDFPMPQGQSSRLAGRRGSAPKPLPDSPGPDLPDKEGLFQRAPRRDESPTFGGATPASTQQKHFPPPLSAPAGMAGSPELHIPNPGSVNRLASTASTSTTRASRGSPPPPETPVGGPDDVPGGGIEARYAAAGIAGTGTLTDLQARNTAAAQRMGQHGGRQPAGPSGTPQPTNQPPRRRWTPTEDLSNHPHGSPITYQGQTPVTPTNPDLTAPGRATSPPMSTSGRGPSALEQDMQRVQISSSPPPSYSSVTRPAGGTTSQGYPNEKAQARPGGTPSVAAAGVASAPPSHPMHHQTHPAFANDPQFAQQQQQQQQQQQSRPESQEQYQQPQSSSQTQNALGVSTAAANAPPLPLQLPQV